MNHPSPLVAAQTYRLWLAFAAVPFAAALIAYLGFQLIWAIGGHSSGLVDSSDAAAAFALLAGAVGLVVTIAGAVPAVRWLMKRGPVSLGQLGVLGLILGNAPFVLYVVLLVLPMTILHVIDGTMSRRLLPLSELIGGTLRAIAIGSVMGGLSAAVFWLIGIHRTGGSRGDRDEEGLSHRFLEDGDSLERRF